ncbi:hypothetical protein GCM10009613_09600 [Pseudonocardia kongjuensis]|uniref:Uncharacterized protein n=1 Tax=Pseudonocardia kongjuensis TaxID=102227 RepID=A0ABP4I5L4_9PSEU
MTGLLPVDRLYAIGVVVRDLEAATAAYAEMLGIDEWEVREFGPDRVDAATAHGRPVTPTFRTATGTTAPPEGATTALGTPIVPVTFELVQPLRGESPFQEFRFVRGQGISHLTVAVQGPEEFARLRDELAGAGLAIAGSLTLDGTLERHFVDTRAALGGYLVEIRVPLRPGGDELAVTDRWTPARRSAGEGPVEVQGVNHFGVVVDDLMATLPEYDRLLGLGSWKIRNWRTEPGRLENATYQGGPVEHEYFTARTQISDFGFEIIQPTLGPSHYNRDFRDVVGPGVHHIQLHATTDEAAFEGTAKHLDAAGAPVVMGADLFGGGAAFRYHDTGPGLGGWVLETVLMRGEPDREAMAPDYVVDLAAT